MGNWTTRKSRTYNGIRQTTTITTGKGVTNSYSYGGKNGRLTFSQGPDGRVRTTQTVRNGDMYMRKTTVGAPKTRRSSKKMSKAEAQIIVALLSSPYFWIIIGLVYVVSLFK